MTVQRPRAPQSTAPPDHRPDTIPQDIPQDIEAEITRVVRLFDIVTDALSDLAAEMESLRALLRAGDIPDMKQADQLLRDVQAWMKNYVITENRLAELKEKLIAGRTDLAAAGVLDLENARLEIGRRLDRLRAAQSSAQADQRD